ncbi:RGG repeats nuclear RNA binding protein A-like isoform X2 [Phragmites australis]|uniref:RGG repeats nuclear RNA binding protein A-like isoform X2 n=1 Tax=Phragmites australis TaxID=29695 RepID=UPI002D770A52|nr:RGG repeats nuclear RNA binding protein A-like isoform X2 [Phragmites australis]
MSCYERIFVTFGIVRDSRSGGAPSRGGFGRGERGRGRGGRGYGQNREFGSEDANGFQGGYGAGGGARAGGEGAQDRERGPQPPYRGGGGRRGGYRDGEFGDDSERPPRRTYERHSGTGRGYEVKREGAGRGNWGTTTDEIIAQETEEGLKLDAPVPEKQDAQEDAPQAEENKDNKDATVNEEEEKEEDKEMTLEEFEKIREEKRKALLALKTEERKVEVDKDLRSMQPLSTKKGNDDVFIKLGSDKDALKKKENAERAKKSLSINEFLKPAEGERYYGGRGRGRGRGDRGGFRGGYGGGYRAPPAAPAIQDQAEFPSLGGK